MTQHQDESLLDKAKRMLGMGDEHDDGHDHDGHEHDGHDHDADAHASHASHASHGGDETATLGQEPGGGHPRDLDEHATAPDAGVSDAARSGSSLDANESPSLRRDEYAETGAASGQIAMPGGEEPVVGDEDRDATRR